MSNQTWHVKPLGTYVTHSNSTFFFSLIQKWGPACFSNAICSTKSLYLLISNERIASKWELHTKVYIQKAGVYRTRKSQLKDNTKNLEHDPKPQQSHTRCFSCACALLFYGRKKNWLNHGVHSRSSLTVSPQLVSHPWSLAC